MKIAITKDHIAEAKRKDSNRCMIADAIAAKTDGQFIRVDLQTIRYSDMKSGKRYTFLTPTIAQRAIINFDQGRAVEPFSFTLKPPVATRDVMHVHPDPEAVKRAHKKYHASMKARRKMSAAAKKRHANGLYPTKAREFGVCMLGA